MAYFQARRVGDTVARVRELDTIRQFLTSSAITLALDLFFAIIFLVVLFIYSPLLTLVVAGALPLYVLLSLGLTPIFRERLNERFKRGAENQAFLVETVSGVETVKSMALEPVMQTPLGGADRRLCQLGLRGHRRGQPRHPDHHPDQQGDHRADPVPRRRPGDSQQADGRRTGRLQHDLLPTCRARAAPGPAVAGLPAGADFDRPPGRHPQHHPRARPDAVRPACRAIRGDIRLDNISFRYRLDAPAGAEGDFPAEFPPVR